MKLPVNANPELLLSGLELHNANDIFEKVTQTQRTLRLPPTKLLKLRLCLNCTLCLSLIHI